MRRRELILSVGGAVLAAPLAALAQVSERPKRLAVAMSTAEDEPHEQSAIAVLTAALEQLGWAPGHNLEIAYRWGAGDARRMEANARELVALAPDAILAKGGVMPALRKATESIPIVFVVTGDEAALSYAGNFAHPQRNITGFTAPESELVSKRLQLLRDIAPHLTRILYLWSRDVGGPASPALYSRIAADAEAAGVTVVDGAAEAPTDLERIVSGFVQGTGDGLVVAFNAFTTTHRAQIVALAARYRLPAVYPMEFFADSGGLFSYGFDQDDTFRQAATYLDRILKGTKVGDLPVQFPTRFKLVINLKTAKTLGLTVPQSILARVDEVIE
jgi:putative tryptophan/tyrosine transport system substrate-binding protein